MRLMSAERLGEMCFGLSRRRRSLVGCQSKFVKEVGGAYREESKGSVAMLGISQ